MSLKNLECWKALIEKIIRAELLLCVAQSSGRVFAHLSSVFLTNSVHLSAITAALVPAFIPLLGLKWPVSPLWTLFLYVKFAFLVMLAKAGPLTCKYYFPLERHHMLIEKNKNLETPRGNRKKRNCIQFKSRPSACVSKNKFQCWIYLFCLYYLCFYLNIFHIFRTSTNMLLSYLWRPTIC